MNKIEELAKQSGWNDWTDDDNWIHPWYQERGYLTLNDLEQFAELIVKECCKIILDNGYHNPIMRIRPENPEDIVTYVKEHFGIDDNLQ